MAGCISSDPTRPTAGRQAHHHTVFEPEPGHDSGRSRIVIAVRKGARVAELRLVAPVAGHDNGPSSTGGGENGPSPSPLGSGEL